MSGLNRPKLNLRAAYERVKSAITGIKKDITELEPIAKDSSGNGIYNGKMTISQRGDFTTLGAIVHDTYSLDRWKTNISTVTASVQDTVGAIRLESTSNATGNMALYQKVERFADYSDKTITVSMKVTSNLSDARISIWDGTTTYYSTGHTGGGEEELLSMTVTLSTVTALFCYLRTVTSSGTSIALVSGDYIEFTDVRLDLGSHRLSGDREYAEELALCQRYYQSLGGAAKEMIASGAFYSTTLWLGVLLFEVEMRVVPTLSYSAPGDFTTEGNVSTQASSAIALVSATTKSVRLNVTTAASVQGVGATLEVNAGKYLAFSAEL